MAASKAEGDGRNVQAVLAKSAQGATFLVVLQIGSRALTFIVNQILLRYLSPDLLGISSQLELFSISVLYFARESIRVALQRHGEGPVQRDGAGTQSPSKGNEKRITDAYDHERRAQEAVNMSYIAVALGPLLALILAKLYLDKAGPVVLAVPYIRQSLYLYALAAVVELCIEPCFVIAQQRMLYGLRASSEATATLVRCFVTCGTAIWASKNNRPLGALPFSLGQLSFAVTLNLVYYSRISAQNPDRGFYLIPRALKSMYFRLHTWPAL